MLLRPQRKFHHAFQELVRRQADEVVHDELLGVEADEVAQLQRPAARGIDEIPVPVVDHDDVSICISARPGPSGGSLECITWQALRRDGRGAELPHQFVSDGDQPFAGTNNVALPHRDHHTREAGLVRRQEGDGLVVHPGQGVDFPGASCSTPAARSACSSRWAQASLR